MADYLHACGLVVLVERAASKYEKCHAETETETIFITEISKCTFDSVQAMLQWRVCSNTTFFTTYTRHEINR